MPIKCRDNQLLQVFYISLHGGSGEVVQGNFIKLNMDIGTQNPDTTKNLKDFE